MAMIMAEGKLLLCCYVGDLAPDGSCQKLADSDYSLWINDIRFAYCSAEHRDAADNFEFGQRG